MQNIQSIILASIQSLYGITLTENTIEISPAPKRELGEYCIGIFSLAKPLGKSPNIIAPEVAEELAKHTEVFVSTNSIGGYVNFFLTDAVWIKLFQGIVIASETKGSAAIQEAKDTEKNPQSRSETAGQLLSKGALKTIIVDYIGANAGKPLHIAHICTPSIGQVICNVYRHLGYRVIGDSHFGDWGGIFGKLINGWRNDDYWEHISKEKDEGFFKSSNFKSKYQFWPKVSANEKEIIKSSLLEELGVNLLLDIYQWFHFLTENGTEWQIVLSEGNEHLSRKEFQYLSGIGIDLSNSEELKHHEENVELWKKFTSISIAETEKKLDLLNVHATYNIGESFYEGLGLRPNDEDYPDLEYTMKDVVKELIKKGIATENEDGSVGVIFPEESKLSSCVLQKKDGTGLYLTSDLAAIRYRLTNGWNPEKIIYSVDVRQQLHLRQVFWIAQKAWGKELGADNVEIFHAFNGFIKLKEGAMSTRHGTVIFLEALIGEGNERTQKILEEKGRIGEKALKEGDIQAITIAAIKYSYLAQDREKDVTFDWDKALSFEGNSGPYIQYAYVRAKKIAKEAGMVIANDSETIQDTKIDSSSGLDRFVPRDDGTIHLSSYDKSLIQMLYKFDAVVDIVANTYKPHHLALYAYDLAVVFNSFYVHTPKILEETDTALRQFRLALVAKTTETLKKSFELLGIQMPSEM